MSKKQWYQVEIECVYVSPGFNMVLGEKQVIAKVKSQGLAYTVANTIAKVYEKNCTVTIK